MNTSTAIQLEISWTDASDPEIPAHTLLNVENMLKIARPYIKNQGWPVDDVLYNLEMSTCSFGVSEYGFVGINSWLVIDLIKYISKHFPNLVFVARGIGQDDLDIWMRRLKNGQELIAIGPFSEEEFSSPGLVGSKSKEGSFIESLSKIFKK